MIRFDYPTVGAPTTSVVLARATEQLPIERPLRRLQTRYTTDAGATIVSDWGDSYRAFASTLFPLDAAERAALESFFDTVVMGGANTFDWTGDDQLWVGVRFQQDVLDIKQTSGVHFRVNINLRQG